MSSRCFVLKLQSQLHSQCKPSPPVLHQGKRERVWMDGQTQIKLTLWKDRSSRQQEVPKDFKPVLLRKNFPRHTGPIQRKAKSLHQSLSGSGCICRIHLELGVWHLAVVSMMHSSGALVSSSLNPHSCLTDKQSLVASLTGSDSSSYTAC